MSIGISLIPDLIVLNYIFIGLACIIFNIKIKQWYIVLLYFMLSKIIFDYNKCTISYFECKIRGVKKYDGYIYQFLDKFIKLRNEKYKLFTLISFTAIFTIFYFKQGGLIII